MCAVMISPDFAQERNMLGKRHTNELGNTSKRMNLDGWWTMSETQRRQLPCGECIRRRGSSVH